jgi:alkanesulfonate monooxygenase SsuD/methylene tetrahydromethanopterin reductase-like flavin-dependent oxidoreductase (luciferase family)
VGFGRELDDMAHGHERAVDTLVDALCAFGEPAKVRDRIEGYARAGVDSVVVYPVPYGDDPSASILRTIRALSVS